MRFSRNFKEHDVFVDKNKTFGIIYDKDDYIFYMYDLDISGNIIDATEGIINEINQKLFNKLNSFFNIKNILNTCDIKILKNESISMTI